jgi:hypothetical protein
VGLDDSLFDNITGLGELNITLTGVGNHQVSGFFDHEITESQNSYFNETGSAVGTVAVGQSWEVDKPGWLNGDIYSNFAAGSLDNSIGMSIYGNTSFPDDVSMAMGWDFSLAMDEQAVISFSLSETEPGAFYLAHADSGSNKTIYLSSNLTISQVNAVPEPSILLLFGIGFAGLAIGSRRRKS